MSLVSLGAQACQSALVLGSWAGARQLRMDGGDSPNQLGTSREWLVLAQTLVLSPNDVSKLRPRSSNTIPQSFVFAFLGRNQNIRLLDLGSG